MEAAPDKKGKGGKKAKLAAKRKREAPVGGSRTPSVYMI